tara:strand:- start:544 stop:1317 length:774 start_codon:yes stop_codon:yes gene_type:complete
VINLNKLFILLFLLIFISCENANYNKYTSDKEFFKTTSLKNNKAISQYNYNFSYSGSENFQINSKLEGFVVYHKSLPIPAVLRISNPNDIDNYEVVRNVFIETSSKNLELSGILIEKLSLKSDVYIEYLRDESKNLRTVELSKETSVIDLNSNEIITEEILDKPIEISEKLEINEKKLSKISSLTEDGELVIFVFVGKYPNYSDARLDTNKIRNLDLTISSENGSFEVLAGPFRSIDVDERLAFLLNNGFNNAKIYR